ncbi:MAG: T9SS type A sorting domain-containing protein [Bacteroidia bacterium]
MRKIVFLICFIGIGLLAKGQTWGLDSTFGNGGIVITNMGTIRDAGLSVMLQTDGKIVGVGYSDNGNSWKFSMVRYNTDGSIDSTFGTNGKVLANNGGAEAATLQPDQKILLSGSTGSSPLSSDSYALLRFNIDGSPDSSFGTYGRVNTTFGDYDHRGFGVIVQPDNKIVQCGTLRNQVTKFTLTRFEVDGSLDSTFGTNGSVITDMQEFGETYFLSLQNDGKIIQSGRLRNGSSMDFVLIRYLSNGIIDSTFGINGMVLTDIEGDDENFGGVAIQPDGKILGTGRVDNNSNPTDRNFWLIRFNEDGSLDNTFGTGGKVSTDFGYDDISIVLILLSDGKIIVSGWIHKPNDVADLGIAKYNTDGSLDTTFGTNGKIITTIGNYGDYVYSGAEQPNGKIILFGFTDRGSGTVGDWDFFAARYGFNGHSIGINDIDNTTNVQIYPNPTTSTLTIQNASGLYHLSDITGKTLLSGLASGETFTLDISALSSGVYFLTLSEGGQQVVSKVVKQ